MDHTVRTGANFLVFKDTPQVYSSYRFLGKVSGSCDIAEIEFIGTVAVDEDQIQSVCNVQLTVGSETKTLS